MLRCLKLELFISNFHIFAKGNNPCRKLLLTDNRVYFNCDIKCNVQKRPFLQIQQTNAVMCFCSILISSA